MVPGQDPRSREEGVETLCPGAAEPDGKLQLGAAQKSRAGSLPLPAGTGSHERLPAPASLAACWPPSRNNLLPVTPRPLHTQCHQCWQGASIRACGPSTSHKWVCQECLAGPRPPGNRWAWGPPECRAEKGAGSDRDWGQGCGLRGAHLADSSHLHSGSHSKPSPTHSSHPPGSRCDPGKWGDLRR